MSYAPIFDTMLGSSLWEESYEVRVCFVSMLVMKDHNFIVRGTAKHISRMANMKEQEVIECLKILESPDSRRVEVQEFEGRRIRRVNEAGHVPAWLILNGSKYVDLMRAQSGRSKAAIAQAKWRAKQKALGIAPKPRASGGGPLRPMNPKLCQSDADSAGESVTVKEVGQGKRCAQCQEERCDCATEDNDP